MRKRPVFLPELGEYLRTLREEHGWNQLQAVDIARRRRITLSYNTLRWIEDGKIKNPEPGTLKALSALYGVAYEGVVAKYSREKFEVEGTQPRPEPQATQKDFITLPLFSTPISRGRALVIEPNADRDTRLAFRRDFVRRCTRPVALRVGRKEVSMKPTIEPGDVLVIDQNLTRRRRPPAGRIFAINEGPLTGTDGGALHRVDRSGHTLILSSDHPDKAAYPTRTFEVTARALPDILLGDVVWVGRRLGPGTRREGGRTRPRSE